MRVGRAHHRGIGLAHDVEIVAEAAGADDKPRILVARDRLADETKTGVEAVHRRAPAAVKCWR